MPGPSDPAAFLRDLFGEWQKLSGGGEEAPQGGMPPAFRAIADRALGAANMPSKADLEMLSARIGRMEAALFRIEAALADLARPTAPEAKADTAP